MVAIKNRFTKRFRATEIKRHMRGDASALMLFGSHARGDFVADSDIDVLQVSNRRASAYRSGRFTFSAYSRSTLLHLASHGSLFILHLKTDGEIVSDPRDQLGCILAAYQKPRNYRYFREQLRGALPLLACTPAEYYAHHLELHRIAIFLLRSVCYAACAELGRPTFGMVDVARVLRDERLVDAYELKSCQAPIRPFYALVAKLVAEYLRGRIYNPRRSIEAYVVAEADRFKLVRAFGLKLLDVGPANDFYGIEAQRTEDLLCPLP